MTSTSAILTFSNEQTAKRLEQRLACLLYNNPESTDCTSLLCGISSHLKFWSASGKKKKKIEARARERKPVDVCSQQNYSQTHAFIRAAHVWRRRVEGCRRLLSGRCEADDDLRINIFGVRQTEDCYSAQHSGGSRLKEQPGPRAWCVSLCVCLGSQKTNRDTCRLTLPDADKTAKECAGPPAHIAARSNRRKKLLIHFMIVCLVCPPRHCHLPLI